MAAIRLISAPKTGCDVGLIKNFLYQLIQSINVYIIWLIGGLLLCGSHLFGRRAGRPRVVSSRSDTEQFQIFIPQSKQGCLFRSPNVAERFHRLHEHRLVSSFGILITASLSNYQIKAPHRQVCRAISCCVGRRKAHRIRLRNSRRAVARHKLICK